MCLWGMTTQLSPEAPPLREIIETIKIFGNQTLFNVFEQFDVLANQLRVSGDHFYR